MYTTKTQVYAIWTACVHAVAITSSSISAFPEDPIFMYFPPSVIAIMTDGSK